MLLDDLTGLGASCRKLCGEFLARDPISVERLREITDRHIKGVEVKADSGVLLDVALARKIAEAINGILRSSPPPSPDHHAAVQLAVLYFVEHDDADPDTESVLGFEDDAQVLNAVLRYLGRQDLLVPIP